MSLSRSVSPRSSSCSRCCAARSWIRIGAGGVLVLGVDGQAAFLGQLVEREAAARGVEQVGGELGVEDEVLRDGAERLGVVGDHGPLAGRGDELGRVVHLAGQRLVAAGVGAEPPALRARDQLALGRLGRDRHEVQLVSLEARDVGRRGAGLDRDGAGLGRLGPGYGLGLGLEQRLLQAPQRVAQLPVAEHRAQVAAVGHLRELGLEVELDRDVAHHRRQLLGEPGRIGVLDQVLLALGAGDLVDAGEHGLEVAEALEQLGGGLVPDPRDAGDVVARVALEPDEVGDLLRRDAVALDHALAVVDLRVGDPAAGGHDPHAVADELVGVAVAGDDHHRDAALPGLLDQRGDHVVGLEALDADVAVAEGLDERPQVRPLELEQVGAGGALGLVVRGELLAAAHPGVPDHHGRHLAVVREDLHEHRREAEDRVGRAPVGGRDRLREREERPVGERVPVDQEQLAGGVSVGLGHAPRRLVAVLPRGDTRSPEVPGIGL